MSFEMENNKVGSKKDNDNSNSEFLRVILNKCRMIMKQIEENEGSPKSRYIEFGRGSAIKQFK